MCVCVCVLVSSGVITGLDPVLPTANASTERPTTCYEVSQNSSPLVIIIPSFDAVQYLSQYFALYHCRLRSSSRKLEATTGAAAHNLDKEHSFMVTCLCWILGYMRLEIWYKIGLSGD